MYKSDFDRLLERYVQGKVTEQEREKIEAWLDVVKTGDNTDLEMTKEEEERIFQRLNDKFTSAQDIAKEKKTRPLGVQFGFLRIAAAITLLLVMSYALWQVWRPTAPTWTNTTAQMEKVILNDGSLVWLRGPGKVNYYFRNIDGTRQASFEGEALFEVAKDATHPFIMQCGPVTVTVLGTSFNVRTTGDQVEVTVLTGKVNLSSEKNSKGIDVKPLEVATYRNDGTFSIKTAQQQEITSLTARTDYHMQFDDHALNEIAQRLERKFNVPIHLANPDIGNCRITIDLTDQSLETSLQMLAEVLDVTYVKENNTITIDGASCH